MVNRNTLLRLSLLLNLLLVCAVLNVYYFHWGSKIRSVLPKPAQTAAPKRADHRGSSFFRLAQTLEGVYRSREVRVAMFGGSIIGAVDWNELLGRSDVAGRGVFGDTVEGCLDRVPQIVRLHPKICFIMAGGNNIRRGDPTADVFKKYIEIVSALRKNDVIPVIVSILYLAEPDQNKRVEKLNGMLKGYAEANGLEFIDLNRRLSEDRVLKDEYTPDGIHLLGNGYGVWRDEVEAVLKKKGV